MLLVGGRVYGAALAYPGVVIVHVVFQAAMPEALIETVLLHLGVGLVCRPIIVGHTIDCSHDTGPMPSAMAMDKHRLVRGVVYDLQELLGLALVGPRPVGQPDS